MQLQYFKENILPQKDKMFRLALCVLRNKEEAEDIVQDSMLKIWNGEENGIDNPAGYCTTVTKNLSLDRLRQKENRVNTVQIETVSDIAETDTPFHTMQKNEQLNLVEQLIERLPERKRLLIHLRDIEGESYKRIAEILSITESLVKTDLFRARQELKQYYKNIDSYERL
jgi:RNA polymerase sigma-70 factor (ECF subfamily)